MCTAKDYLAPGGLPPNVVPIPVNTRDIVAELTSYLRTYEPKVARILYNTWNAQKGALRFQEIRNAIREGQIDYQWLGQWRTSYGKMVNEKMAPMWREAWERGASIVDDGFAFAREGWAADVAGPVKKWIEQRGAQLVVDMTDEQRRALSTLIRHYGTYEPLDADAIARNIRAAIGPTNHEVDLVWRKRAKWLAEGKHPSEVERMTGNYFSRMVFRRGKRIARTEMNFAYNQGQLDVMKQANEANLFGGVLIKIWDATGDRTCPDCLALDGEPLGLAESFAQRTGPRVEEADMVEVEVPPLHPFCGCGVRYEVYQNV